MSFARHVDHSPSHILHLEAQSFKGKGHMNRRSPLLVLASLLVVGCDDVRNPAGLSSETPSAQISDGRFAGGNDDFFFLPPLMPDPKGLPQYDAGAFNPALRPTVNVCQLDKDPTKTLLPGEAPAACTSILVANFTSDQVTLGGEQYHVNWHTDDSNLGVLQFYRLQVFLGSVRLGFADIDPMSSARELRNARTGEVIPLVNGRTLPVKFRIESGALCTNKADCGEFTVTNAGGTFVTNTKDAGIQFKPGFLPEGVKEITIRIERIATGSENRCHGAASAALWKEFEGCYDITSDPDLRPFGGIQSVAIAGQCVEVDLEDPLFPFLQPYKSHNGAELQRLASAPAPFLDCEGFRGSPAQVGQASNPLLRFATAGLGRLGVGLGKVFGVRTLHAIDLGLGEELPIGSGLSRFNWAIGLEAEISGGAEQSVGFGLQAPQPLEVHVRGLAPLPRAGSEVAGDEHPGDIAGVTVRFTVTEGDGYFELGEGGPIRTRDVVTNADGRASTSFTAASNDAGNVVTAMTPTFDSEMRLATFSLVGLPSDLVIQNLARSIEAPTAADPLSWTFDVSNTGSGKAIASTARFVLSDVSEGTMEVASYEFAVPALAPGASVAFETEALGPLDVGNFRVRVTADVTTDESTPTVVEADEENNAASHSFVVRSAAGAILGTVVDGITGAAIPGASVTVVGTSIIIVADAAGRYRFGNIQPGQYTVRASMVGYTPLEQVVTVTSGADITSAFNLDPVGPTIDGVLSEGEWDDATTYGPFAIALPFEESTTATLLVKNTGAKLFMAVRFAADLSTYRDVIAGIRMDENANGTWDNREDGWVVQQRNSGALTNTFFDEFFSCDVSPCQGQNDNAWGGTTDGSTASTDSDRPTIIEVSKGVNTDDRDALLTKGQSLRFFLLTNVRAPESGLTGSRFPVTGWVEYTVR